RARLLGEDLVASVAVDAGAARTDERRRPGFELGGDRREEPRRLRARLQDLPLRPLGPTLIEICTAEVDERLDSCEPRSVDRPPRRIPLDLVGPGRVAADEPDDVVSVRPEGGDQCRADEPRRAADCNLHATSFAPVAETRNASPRIRDGMRAALPL